MEQGGGGMGGLAVMGGGGEVNVIGAVIGGGSLSLDFDFLEAWELSSSLDDARLTSDFGLDDA